MTLYDEGKLSFIPQVLFAACVSCSLAELPANYGLPDASTGYSYHHQAEIPQSSHSEYIEQHVGHQTSEGLNLDPNLLHKIKEILVQHENSGSNSGSYLVSNPSDGAPQLSYGPPSHWSSGSSSRVIGIEIAPDAVRQSHQVAQYISKDRYAPSHSGWSSSNSGYSVGNSGWSVGGSSLPVPAKSQGWSQQSADWTTPLVLSSPVWNSYPAALLAKPAIKYGAPQR